METNIIAERFDEVLTSLKPFMDAREDARTRVDRLLNELAQVAESRVILSRSDQDLKDQVSVALASGNSKAAIDLKKKMREIRVDILDSDEIEEHLKTVALPVEKERLIKIKKDLSLAVKSRMPRIKKEAEKMFVAKLEAAFDVSDCWDDGFARFVNDVGNVKGGDHALTPGTSETVLKGDSKRMSEWVRVNYA